MQQIRLHAFGAPENILDTSRPGPGQGLADVEAADIHYMDVCQRRPNA